MRKKWFKVYLAHPITSQDAESKEWKAEFMKMAEENKLIVLDPLDLNLKDGRDDADIVRGNKRMIAQSDAMVAYASVPSAGTSMEIYYANLIGVPVLTYCVRPVVPAWIKMHSERVFTTLDHVFLDLHRRKA
jgi:nucleoside 2-deoxyribosyltransferase